MKHSMSRTIIETAVRKALRSIKSDPDRSLRNIVDMALEFSKGRFQQDFLTIVQTMLRNTNSAYYTLAREVITRTDEERLVTFGMNIGYNSCTFGADLIRKNEAELGHKIPWSIALQLSDEQLISYWNRYDAVIDEGEKLGIYTWLLSVQEELAPALGLVNAHPDCAFLLFCEADALDENSLDLLMEQNNLMTVLRYEENCDTVCRQLSERGLLYAVYHVYTMKDLASIINGDLFCSTQELGGVFTFLLAERDCPTEIQNLVYQETLRTRKEQKYKTLAAELYRDSCYIDHVISDDVCYVNFDQNGAMFDWDKHLPVNGTLFDTPLQNLLKEAFSTQKQYPTNQQ